MMVLMQVSRDKVDVPCSDRLHEGERELCLSGVVSGPVIVTKRSKAEFFLNIRCGVISSTFTACPYFFFEHRLAQVTLRN